MAQADDRAGVRGGTAEVEGAVRAGPRECMPSGAAHDGRVFAPFPFYVARADGAYKWDVDGHRYIDGWSGHGAMILGHNHPAVTKAIIDQAQKGTHYSAGSEIELRWAELITLDRARRRARALHDDGDRDHRARHPHRARPHRPHQDREVPRPLPRPARLGDGGGEGSVRDPGLGRRPGRDARADAGGALQRPRPREGAARRARGGGGDPRAGGVALDDRADEPGLPQGAARSSRRSAASS